MIKSSMHIVLEENQWIFGAHRHYVEVKESKLGSIIFGLNATPFPRKDIHVKLEKKPLKDLF